jgi:M6 family metalloprotease-like protein
MSAVFGQVVTVMHQGNTEVQLRVFGDERYSRHETLDGYTVIYEKDYDTYFYAEVVDGRFVSSRVPITQPPPHGLPKHLQESAEVRKARSLERMMALGLPLTADGPFATFGPVNGLLQGRQVSRGPVRGLTILVDFQDVTNTVPTATIDAMLNGDNFTANGNVASVRRYFEIVSNGQLIFSNDVVGPFKLSHNRSFYHQTLMVDEVVQLAAAGGVDLSRYDSRHEGIVDALSILYAGPSLFTSNDSLLWPHNWTRVININGIRTNLYQLSGIGRSANDLIIGTFCHECGHMLCRFPDLYDYGNRDGDFGDSAGLGMYCLMASGSNSDGGRSPSPVSAYLRDLVNWCTAVDINDPRRYELRHGDYGTVYKYRTNRSNEYFIIENRLQRDMDRALPANGLAVYHCDIKGSNEFQEGTVARHYQCALLQADGHRDLETVPNNYGDGGDLYTTHVGVVVADDTNPSSRMWDGADSGLRLSNVEIDDDVIRVTVGAAEPSPSVIAGEAAPDKAIPDFPAAGITSAITLAGNGNVQDMKVNVQITHTYIGDLRIELLSPANRRTVLHNRAGGSLHDLNAIYTSAPPSVLGAQIGQPVQGRWVLRITDLARRDVGRLVKWGLEVTAG